MLIPKTFSMTHFDPYHQWLGIPPAEQPATHYRLLGIEPFEADAEVIGSAADRQMGHVRTFQLGPQGAISQRLLCELSTARLILLHPQRKAGYDAVLRSAVPMTRLEEEPRGPAPTAKATRANPQTATTSELAPGTVISQYRILEPAGGSAFGKVYKAQHAETGRYFFVKVLPADSARNEEVRKRFERECQILVKLDHPNLIVGRESGEHAGLKYLVMDYVLGTDLATLVKQQGPLPIEQGVDYAVQTARGLTQLHMHGVFHRNIKPHVLLVDLQGNLRITNLLLAKIGESSTLEGEALTTMGEQMGSLDYLPPEQALDAGRLHHKTTSNKDL